MTEVLIELTVNGRDRTGRAQPRMILADFLRDELMLTGTHIGCEQGACGACTVLVNGEAVYSCLMFAVQAQGCAVTTVEGLAGAELDPLQTEFRRNHAVQCGFCTPGFLTGCRGLLRDNPHPSEQEIRAALAGNLCRCTGYENIVKAVRAATGAGHD